MVVKPGDIDTRPEGIGVVPDGNISDTNDLFHEITIPGIDLRSDPEQATLSDCREYAKLERLDVYHSNMGGEWMRYYYTSTGMTVRAILNTNALTDFEKLLLMLYTKQNSFKKPDDLHPEDIEREYTQKILLKKILQDRGLTIKDLAYMNGTSAETVSKNLINGTSEMKLNTFMQYLDTLGYRVAVLPKADRTPHKGYALNLHPNKNSELEPFTIEPPGRSLQKNDKIPLGIPDIFSLKMGGGV